MISVRLCRAARLLYFPGFIRKSSRAVTSNAGDDGRGRLSHRFIRAGTPRKGFARIPANGLVIHYHGERLRPHLGEVNREVSQEFSFKNVIQTVFPVFPVKSPKRGSTGNDLIKSRAFIFASFHLKISTPFGARTRQHSLNPATMSCRHVSLLSSPYFLLITLFYDPLVRCGGSYTTSRNAPSGNGISRKSPITSGFTHQFGFQLFWNAPFSTSRKSMKSEFGLSFRYQNIRPPQQASRTGGNGLFGAVLTTDSTGKFQSKRQARRMPQQNMTARMNRGQWFMGWAFSQFPQLS